MIPTSTGGAVDDAYLYRFSEDEYLLVVNAANRQKDWEHFQKHLKDFTGKVELSDRTEEIAMLSLQGPKSADILSSLIEKGDLPEPIRNALSIATIKGVEVKLARTGYTGEPICFELFINANDAPVIWNLLIEKGVQPVGLGARDTLRLEAGLPLYGHELGNDPEGNEIPIFACPLARYAISFSPVKGDFIGKDALVKQHQAYKAIIKGDFSKITDLPRRIMPLAIASNRIARAGDKVYLGPKHVGYITSGTMVPYWKFTDETITAKITDQHGLRPVALAYLDSDLKEEQSVEVEIRGKRTAAMIVPYHLRSEAPPYARPILYDHKPQPAATTSEKEAVSKKVLDLLEKSARNTQWRQRECINLIPSEQTASPMVRLLSIMDPAFRYAEHRRLKALYDTDVFYYQGTDFIKEVELLLEAEMRQYLGCSLVETRLISGQMANATVFSAMVDYINRADRKTEPRRIGYVMNNHIMKGGHLSSQPMGALRDFIAYDPRTDRPAVVSFPVLKDNPYKIDLPACKELIARYKPELIILGKSVVLHPEPVAAIRSFVEELSLDTIIMYDMAHVLGLVGPYFQQPFKEGVDVVTGSTHKTFFGTQRGIVAANFPEQHPRYPLWEAIRKRTFPGAVSNHHLGTMLGLLMAAYEMNYFKDEYQKNVISNAKAFASALKRCGLDVAGDPDVSYTETHQVVINVGYSRGPEIARKLEENNIIVNYQASPAEEGFTAAGSLRMGVAEMTRFGLTEKDFETVAELIAEVILKDKPVKDKVKEFRSKFLEMRYCFSDEQYAQALEKIYELVR
ncbi:MAG: glycine cleavage system protein T [Planctomycetes bacterium]|nr:glycine cleavage system protein T [Planctomycetota bacterium]